MKGSVALTVKAENSGGSCICGCFIPKSDLLLTRGPLVGPNPKNGFDVGDFSDWGLGFMAL